MFETVLIANRGEIACRVIRTLRRLGIRSVAVCSEADRCALFTRLADRVVEIGPAPARDSYLRADRILEAAARTGARAIHPGYGFLSENAEFAEACSAAGVRFIGPPANAIRAMGLKDAAKALMQGAAVPVVPGYHGKDQTLPVLAGAAEQLGFPVLIKAVAGGGGKGMRRVDRASEFAGALDAARREAQAAFGDDRVLIEKYLLKPRHIEIQVFADAHGQVVHLFERDCSLQRRHQKVLEEAPAPGLSAETRAAMGQAAVRAAQAIGYEGAGTVEFIAETEGGGAPKRFYFMEMNTRLQVEHPVTELITGIDLVEWQLRVAAGEKLPLAQEQVPLRGHALEVRLYAEDPEREYLPQTGELVHLALPEPSAHVRVDAGVVQGDAVSVFYDPMIAKLVVWDADRERAVRRLRRTLEQVEVLGLTTNLPLLAAIACHPAFAAGDVFTGFLAEHAEALFASDGERERERLALACVGMLEARAQRARPERGADPWSPWADTRGFRVNQDGSDVLRFSLGEQALAVPVRFEPDACVLSLPTGELRVAQAKLEGTRVSFWIAGARCDGVYVEAGSHSHVLYGGRALSLDRGAAVRSAVEAGEGETRVKAPMPGKIIGLLVEPGQRVQRGTALVRLEAMKMEHTLKAGLDGSVAELSVRVGDQVDAGSTLLVLRASEE